MNSFYENVGKGSNSLFHYVFTILLTILGYVFGQIPLYIAMYWSMSNNVDIGKDALVKFQKNPDFSLLHIDKNIGFLLILLLFVFALIALFLGIRFIHKRNFMELISPTGKFDWKRMIWGTMTWLGLLIVVEIGMYFYNPSNYIFRDPEWSFLFLLLITVLILPIQTAFEEIFTRGYLLQSIAYNSKSIFLGFVVSIVVFALMHGFNPETFKYGFWPMMSYYLSAAALLGLIVVFDKRLELAIGVHTATNVFGALFVTYYGAALQTDSLFITNEINPVFLAIEISILGIIFLYMSYKKFDWDIANSFKND